MLGAAFHKQQAAWLQLHLVGIALIGFLPEFKISYRAKAQTCYNGVLAQLLFIVCMPTVRVAAISVLVEKHSCEIFRGYLFNFVSKLQEERSEWFRVHGKVRVGVGLIIAGI